jgi:hypothetical protein
MERTVQVRDLEPADDLRPLALSDDGAKDNAGGLRAWEGGDRSRSRASRTTPEGADHGEKQRPEDGAGELIGDHAWAPR